MSNPEVTGNSSANESRHPGHGGSVDYSAHLGRANIVVPTTSPSGGLPEAPPKYVINILKLLNIKIKILNFILSNSFYLTHYNQYNLFSKYILKITVLIEKH